uniref:Predicted protein n=1 Tax=Hordeum vulgare subsp. vulgare TaxID=112509 RepID=F2EEN6_HORVV|nr:predicted protein [Hordeum vulgare subsp. vulgare]
MLCGVHADGAGTSIGHSGVVWPTHGQLAGTSSSSSDHSSAGGEFAGQGQGCVRGGPWWIAGAEVRVDRAVQIGVSYGGAYSGDAPSTSCGPTMQAVHASGQDFTCAWLRHRMWALWPSNPKLPATTTDCTTAATASSNRSHAV